MVRQRRLLQCMSAGLAAVLATVVLSLLSTSPAFAATSDECTKSINVNRNGENLAVPATNAGSTDCNIGRTQAANSTIVKALQLTLKQCFPAVHLASPFASQTVGGLSADGSFGQLTEAAMKGVQSAIHVSPVDGIYGPLTRNKMHFRSNDIAGRCFPWS
jgi:hypothetical protein